MEPQNLNRSNAAERLCMAYALQKRFRISEAQFAPVLGISVNTYQKRLKRAGLSLIADAAQHSLFDTDDILTKINAELLRFSQLDGLPDKAAVDALTGLAKAVKTISELAKETGINSVPAFQADNNSASGVKPEDVREALSLIDRRIIQLAADRAV